MTTITIELTEFKTVSDSVAWKADILELTDPPSIGIGDSKETALASLFLRVGSYTPFSQHETLKYTTDVKIVEIPLQEAANQPATPEFVVPEYVVQCIRIFDFSDMNFSTATAMSQVLTMTKDENHRGLFTYIPDKVSFLTFDNKEVEVDFSDLRIGSDDEENRPILHKRCQRVGQAILDAQNKPKPIDPDEGLPSYEEVGKFVAGLRFTDEGIFGELDTRCSRECNFKLTGAMPAASEGVFSSSKRVSFCSDGFHFVIDFPCDLTTENLATAIPERIRLVREARAKALQEAGFSG